MQEENFVDVSDINNDGFLDVFVSNEDEINNGIAGDHNFFYFNNPNGNHWLRV